IVLCPGLNDGKSLEETIENLSRLHPLRLGTASGVLSVAVVPVGLSKFRHNLYPIHRVTSEYYRDFLTQTEGWHRKLKPELGTRFVFPSDEWFFYAGRSVPPRAWYEDFPQFEDGVGTCRLFTDQAKRAYTRLPTSISGEKRLTLVTGLLPSNIIRDFAARLSEIRNLKVD